MEEDVEVTDQLTNWRNLRRLSLGRHLDAGTVRAMRKRSIISDLTRER